MRENGYYWVKEFGHLDWCVAEFSNDYPRGIGWGMNNEYFEAAYFHEINPQRILTPDEQAERGEDDRLQAKCDAEHHEYINELNGE